MAAGQRMSYERQVSPCLQANVLVEVSTDAHERLTWLCAEPRVEIHGQVLDVIRGDGNRGRMVVWMDPLKIADQSRGKVQLRDEPPLHTAVAPVTAFDL